MRLLVHGPSVQGHPRLAPAALGLAHRGHEVTWLGRGAEAAAARAPVRIAGRETSAAHGHAQVVLGAGRPLAAAWRGRLAGAGCLIQAADAAGVARWDWRDRWAWSSLQGFALVDPSEADAFRHRPGPLDLERVGLWSDDPPAEAGLPEHPDCEVLERACERAWSRHRAGAPRRAVFLDRDGTLIEEVGYLDDPESVRLLPGVAAALARLRAAGCALVVISNQAGVGRGLFPLERVHRVMARLRRLLRAEGTELDGIYFCPHAPDAGCPCRKPGIELLERAIEDLRLHPGASVMIGDKRIDVEAGKRAGCLSVLVRTGYGREEERLDAADGARPDRVCDDLGEAAGWFLGLSEAD